MTACSFSRLGAATSTVLMMLLSVCQSNAQANLFGPGNAATTVTSAQALPGWANWLWDGQGKVERFATPEGSAALLVNDGPAKQAIFQYANVKACTFEVTAEVAAHEMAAGADGRGATIHVAFDDGQPGLTHDIIGVGSSDWRNIRLSFRATASTRAIVYFFNYGSGTFAVRNARLTERAGCPTNDLGFDLGLTSRAPFTYSPPSDPGDAALSGYCSAASFRAHPVCRMRPQDPGAAAAPLVLANFDQRSSVFSGHSRVDGAEGVDGSGAARLARGVYTAAQTSSGLPGNWSPFDWLRIDVKNASSRPVSVYVEINDDKTTGYWSRVNWTTAAAPGISTIDVPLNGFVGERSVVGDRRRLDRTNIRRLVVTATDGDLVIDNVRLEAEVRFRSAFAELLRFDFTTPIGQVYPEFTRVTAGTMYAERRGFGFSPGTVIGRSEDRRHPVGLLRDWVSIVAGGFDIDLPNDEYRVWIMTEDAGYWEYYPSFTRRRILVQDRIIEDRENTFQEFASRFWRHANDEDLPGDDIWRRYIVPRYKPVVTTATVTNRRLQLRFSGYGDPLAMPVSALIIFPERKAADGDAFLAELWGRLERDYQREVKQVQPPSRTGPVAVPQALDGDLSLFRKPLSELTFATDRPAPDELITNIDITLPRGTTDAVTIGFVANRDLALTSVSIDIEGVSARASMERHKAHRLVQDGSIYTVAPRLLDPLHISSTRPFRIGAGVARRLWIDLTAAKTAAPGVRTGRIGLGFADGRATTIPITIDVKPWSLPRADIPIGYLGLVPNYPLATYPQIAERRERELVDSVKLLRDHGMTAVSGGLGGVQLVEYFMGKPRVDVAQFRKTLAALNGQGFDELLSYDGSTIQGLTTSSIEDTTRFNRPYPDVLRDVLAVIDRETTAVGGPTLVHSIADEPAPTAIDGVLQVARAFKQARPSVKTAAFTSLPTGRRDPQAALAGAIDQIFLGLHTENGIRHVVSSGSRCALYNQPGRYARGVYLLKMRSLGCGGHMQFAFHAVHGDHWYDLDGRESDMVAVFTHPDGELRPSLDLKTYRQSITDYRYLMYVDALVRRTPERPEAREAARFLSEILGAMTVGEFKGFDDAALDRIRAKAIRHIDTLTRS